MAYKDPAKQREALRDAQARRRALFNEYRATLLRIADPAQPLTVEVARRIAADALALNPTPPPPRPPARR